MENAVPRHTLAKETARIGSVNIQFCDGSWSHSNTALSWPSLWKNV